MTATMRAVRIGLVGTGKMARAHSQAYLTAARSFELPVRPVLAVLCGRAREHTRSLASALGWSEAATDWRDVVARPDLDLIDVCTPTASHHEIVCAAAASGKAVLCEKPLAVDVRQAEGMREAVERAGVPHAVIFNYRYAPAVRQARDLLASGRLGKVRQFTFRFLQDWLTDPVRPMSWRLRRREGGGVLLDLGAHVADLVHHLVGPIDRVAAGSHAFVTERNDASGVPAAVDVEDAVEALVTTATGALGTLSVSRIASGHRWDNGFEIYGSRGSVRWRSQGMNDLDLYLDDGERAIQGWRRVSVTDPAAHPWAGAWWGAGHVLGFEETFVHELAAFLSSLAGVVEEVPTFEDGVRAQRLLQAIETAAERGCWVDVKAVGLR